MTRDEHLAFCKRCLNRKFDADHGIVCSLTGQVAAFENNCPDFEVGGTVKVGLDNTTALDRTELAGRLEVDVYEKLREEQDLNRAIVAGFATAVLCALVWGVITVATEMQIGYMAIGVGAAVGYVIRTIGKGIDPIFAYFGAGISLFGCLLGNFFSIIGFVANANDLGYLETLFMLDYSFLPEIMTETFSIMDLFFYFIAISTGYKLSTRQITEQELATIRSSSPE